MARARRRFRLAFTVAPPSLLALLAAGAGAGTWSACHDANGSEAATPNASFGAEVTVTVVGHGRVTTDDARTVNCPGQCFARVFVDPARVDAGAGDAAPPGLGLVARASVGARFARWSFDVVDLGVRASGPSSCSPMFRTTAVPAAPVSSHLALPYGETKGSPPAGREAECAAFTSVPVAYALTATFEDDAPPPRPPPVEGPPIDVLFEPPTLGVVVGHELGIVAGQIYWRFERDGFSGIASGLADGGGGGSTVTIPPAESVTQLAVNDAVVVQHSSGLVEKIDGSGARSALGYLPRCAALVSLGSSIYCRALGPGTTYLYVSAANTSFNYLHALPSGLDLGVDDASLYLSAREDDTQPGQGRVLRTPRLADGGAVYTLLMSGQTAPHDLAVGREHVFWIDDRGPSSSFVNTAAKSVADAGNVSAASRSLSDARFLAIDPVGSTTFWIGVVHTGQPGESSIFQANADDSIVRVFRTGLTGLGGLTADASYVYWTQSDGRVYRAPRSDP